MKRLTTDRPQDNVENTLNLFYVKDKETWIRGGGPAPQYKDVTLDDFMRRQIKARLPIDAPEDWQEFSCMMAEWLMDDPESETGMMALMYAAAWGFAEIRERLKRYEDTGAMPDVLEELLEGMTRIEKLGGWDLVDRWVKAASEGRLVELKCVPRLKPCAENILYIVEDGEVFDDFVTEVIVGENENREVVSLYSMYNGNVCMENDFGKTVFLTEEEAEAALKGEDHGEQV